VIQALSYLWLNGKTLNRNFIQTRIVSIMLLLPGVVMAAPDGADLEQACAGALANGFDDVRGQMCEYYVRPCDCTAGQLPATPRVCLPEGVATPSLARRVLAGLEERPELKRRHAATAAALILVQDYPCRD
jgi:hypothetical protein